ncbi:hypothetical protein ACFE04_022624 [Oxalis oulophora]
MVTSQSNATFAQTFPVDNSDNDHHRPRDASFSCYLDDAEENFIRNLSKTSRDASFSCYLDGAEENFIRKLSESSQNPSFSTHHQYHEKNKNGEIGVFGAEEYYSKTMDDEEISRLSKLGTPSIQRESSNNSNSHTGLLRRKSPMMKFLASFGFSCLEKDFKEINEGEMISATNYNARRESTVDKDLFTTNIGIIPAKIQNLEVFGSPISDNRKFEKNPGVLSRENTSTILIEKSSDSGGNYINDTEIKYVNDGEMIRTINKGRESKVHTEKCFSVPINSTSMGILPEVFVSQVSDNNNNDDDDDSHSHSDVSSDLFEIDSVSGKANNAALSEASIDWSVTTAEEDLIIRPSLINTDAFKTSRHSRMRRVSSDDSFIRIPAGKFLDQPPLAATRSLRRSNLF